MRTNPLWLLPLLLVSSCAVGPAYHPPKISGAEHGWLAPVDPGAVDSEWWKALSDPVLDELVSDALAHNLDLRQAEARLREARENSSAARGRTVPQINASGSAVEQQVSANGQLPVNRIPGFDRRYSLFDAGLDASWELDLWGGVASSVRAADARAQAVAIRAEDSKLRVIGEVVRTYADLRASQSRGALLARDAQLRSEIAGLVELRFRHGESSRSDWLNARQREDAAKALLPEAGASARAAAYSLALLTGKPPEALAQLANQVSVIPVPPPILAAGVRSELLQRRPDVRAAEADLVAATADIGIETANLYPRFSLMGGLGQQSRSAGDLFDGASTRFSIGPSFSWPIFSFGRIRAQIRAASARADASAAVYEKAVLSALTDSEIAANRFAASLAAQHERASAAKEAQAAAELAALRFRKGEDDRIQMLEANSAAIQAGLLASASSADAAAAFVSFSKALGGGVK